MVLLRLIKNKKKVRIETRTNKGQTLIELLVVIGLLALLIPALTAGFLISIENKAKNNNQMHAVLLLQETEEAIKAIKSANWDNINTNGTYYTQLSSNSWTLVAGTEEIGIYQKQVVIEDIQRDINGEIVESGGVVDPSTKKVTIAVSWETPRPSSVESELIFTRYANSQSWVQTTEADFNTGTLTNTVALNNLGVAEGSWSTPTTISNYNAFGNSNGSGLDLAGDNLYLTVENTSSDPDLFIFDSSNPEVPIELSATNFNARINDIIVQNGLAFMTSSTNSQALIVADVSNSLTPTIIAEIAISNTNGANAIFIEDRYAYITSAQSASGAELHIIDISDPTLPYLVGEFEFNNTIEDVYVQGGYAYLATYSNTEELLILNIANRTSPTLVGAFNSISSANGLAVFVEDDRAYLGVASSSGPEFEIIDISNKASPVSLGGLEVSYPVRDIFVKDSKAYLGSQVISILDVSVPSSISVIGSLPNNGLVMENIVVDGDYMFMTSSSNTEELMVIKGGNGDTNSGTVSLVTESGDDSWEDPTYITALNLAGTGEANKVRVDGNYAYVVTDDSGSSADFTIINITNPESPTVSGSINLNTYVEDLYISGNYAYLATGADTEELMIINITNKSSPTKVTGFNLGNNNDPTAVQVVGNYAYVGKQVAGSSNRELYVINVTNPASPIIAGDYNNAGSIMDFDIQGNYIYAGTSNRNGEIVILDISNPTNPVEVGSYNISGSVIVTSVFIDQDILHVGLNQGTFNAYVTFNVANPASPSPLGSYETIGIVNDIDVFNGYAFLATENSSSEVMIINSLSPTSPSLFGSVNLTDNARGIVAGETYAYIANASGSAEFQVIKGGFPGVAESGTFESTTFNAGENVVFNNIYFNANEPAGTNINIQVAINSDNSTWNYVGPDGTGSTYFETNGRLYLSTSSGQYIRLRVFFEGDGLNTPILEHLSISYTP